MSGNRTLRRVSITHRRTFSTLIISGCSGRDRSDFYPLSWEYHSARTALAFREASPLWTVHTPLFFTTVGSVLGLLNPLILKWLIDRILPGRNTWLLMAAVVLLFLSYEGRVVFLSLGGWLTVASSQKFALVLRLELLRHLDILSADYHDDTSIGEKLYSFSRGQWRRSPISVPIFFLEFCELC